jgi:hypothetical protein
MQIQELDNYIKECNASGKIPSFTDFVLENKETLIDSNIFENYYTYSQDDRILNILEYKNVHSYSEFLDTQNRPEVEVEAIEEEDLSEAKEGENNIIVDFIFRRPKIKKYYKNLLDLEKKNLAASDLDSSGEDEKIEKIETMLKKGGLPDAKRTQLSDQLVKLQAKRVQDMSASQQRLSRDRERLSDKIKNIEYNIQKLTTSEYLKKVADKESVKNAFAIANIRIKTADEQEKAAIRDEMNLYRKNLVAIETELKELNNLEEKRGKLDEISDKEAIIKRNTSMSDEEKKLELIELRKTKYELAIDLGNEYKDALKDPENLKKSLNSLLAELDEKDSEGNPITVKTHGGFIEYIKSKLEELEGNKKTEDEENQGAEQTQGSQSDSSQSQGETGSSGSEPVNASFNPYQSIAERFNRLMNK